MKRILVKSVYDAFDFRYRYEGVDYHVLVIGSKHKMDPKDEWAGPLYGSMEHKGVF